MNLLHRLNDVKTFFFLTNKFKSRISFELGIRANWEVANAESRLKQIVGQGKLNNDIASVFVKFWRRKKSDLTAHARQCATFNNSLDQISWRMDVQMRAKGNSEDLQIPCGIVQLDVKNNDGKINVLRFQLDKAEVNEVLSTLNDIRDTLDDADGGETGDK